MSRVHWLVGSGLIGVLLIAGGVYLSQAQHAKPTKRISLQPSSTGIALFPQQTDDLRIAVGAIISPAASLAFYDDIFDYVEEELGRGITMVQRKTYTEVNFLMKERRIDAAFVCSRPYVQGRRDSAMELLCVPVCFGKTEYHSYFIEC
jgi:phosphonate transport system substrate-binding protein